MTGANTLTAEVETNSNTTKTRWAFGANEKGLMCVSNSLGKILKIKMMLPGNPSYR